MCFYIYKIGNIVMINLKNDINFLLIRFESCFFHFIVTRKISRWECLKCLILEASGFKDRLELEISTAAAWQNLFLSSNSSFRANIIESTFIQKTYKTILINYFLSNLIFTRTRNICRHIPQTEIYNPLIILIF